MSVLAWGSGEPWESLWGSRVAGTTGVVADSVPVQSHVWTPPVYRRGSRVHLPPGANVAADWLKQANARLGYDELLLDPLQGELAWWQSILPAIGCNDDPTKPPSDVLIAVQWPAPHPHQMAPLHAWLDAAYANPRVRVVVEGFHFASLYGSDYDGLRSHEREWLELLRPRGLGRTGLLLIISDRPDLGDAAYASCTPDPQDQKRRADEDACHEWLAAGCPVLGTWGHGYATQASRWAAADAIYRAVRKKWPSGPRDQA